MITLQNIYYIILYYIIIIIIFYTLGSKNAKG